MPVAIALPLVALGALRSHACGNSLASVPLDALHSHAYGVLPQFQQPMAVLSDSDLDLVMCFRVL